MAATEPYVRNQLYSIPLAELLPDPNQPRKFFDPAALEELTASITQRGVLEPVLFRVDNGCNYRNSHFIAMLPLISGCH